jgi:hypothetical protein
MKPCRWVRDSEVPGGRFLVPGCWNRAINGDGADCHCAIAKETVGDKLDAIIRRLDRLEGRSDLRRARLASTERSGE